MPELLSIGECMIELYSDQPLEQAETFQKSLAGDSLNILVSAQRLGTSTGYITRVGSDPFTDYLLNTWKAEGIDTSHAKQVDGFNAVHFVAQLPDGDREFVYYRKGSAPSTMQPSDLDADYIASAKIMHVSGITQAISETSRATALRAAQIANESGVAVSYDPNYRHQLWSTDQAREAMEEIIPYVTYFLPSSPADTLALMDTEDPREMAKHFVDRGVKIVSVTGGEDGVVVATKGETFQMAPITPDEVVDTTGAGDAYNGGFLHGLLNGMSVKQAAVLGSITAGLKIRGRGALTTMPTGEEVFDMYDELIE